jgi:hypothetical protein
MGEILKIWDTYVAPATNELMDLGSDDLEFKDIWVDGIAYIDTLNIHVAADFGDIDLTSLGKLEGLDTGIYIDLGTDAQLTVSSDGYLDLTGTTQVRINGNLHTHGYCPSVVTKTDSTYTVLTTDDIVLCNYNGEMTVTLPVANGSGRIYHIKNIHATGDVTIDGNASDTIDGENTFTLTEQYEGVTLFDGGSNVWYIVNFIPGGLTF